MHTRSGKLLLFLPVIALAGCLIAGYRFRTGPLSGLGELRMAQLEGNQAAYSPRQLEPLPDHPLKGKKILFLGSSVTYGYGSLREALPEYFETRFGCRITKEAVSGTTLADLSKDSYVNRLVQNVDPTDHYDLVICQLSTNDASRGISLGEIRGNVSPTDYDTQTVTGAMEYIIRYVQDTWNCPVLFYTNARYDSTSYQAMVDRAHAIADQWNIRILDLWTDDAFNDISSEERALYMDDPIHPHKAGYTLWWGPEIEHQLEAMNDLF